MIALGLSSADLKLFNQSLSTHHSIKITVQILDLNHKYLGDLSTQLIDGQVNIDADAEVTRSLTLQLRDVDHALHLDSTAPSDGALFYDRMIRVIYSVKSELLPRWVDVPIFCGPITKMSRTADVINVECMGKESLVTPPALAYFTRAWGKGMVRADLIRTIMSSYGGETRFSFPAYRDRTPGPVAMKADTNIWALVRSINGSFATRQLFYDGRGVLVMRTTPQTVTYTFRTGVGGNITSVPVIDYDLSNVRNMVRVTGAIPKGKKTPVVADYGLPFSHSLSPVRLGRNGKPRVLLELVSEDNAKTVGQARDVARARCNALALQAIDVSLEALVAPHLEPNDIYLLKTPDVSVNARYKKATIPLKQASGTVGYLSSRTINRTRIRRR